VELCLHSIYAGTSMCRLGCSESNRWLVISYLWIG